MSIKNATVVLEKSTQFFDPLRIPRRFCGHYVDCLPISFALLATLTLMMLYVDLFDPQITTEAIYNSADSYPLIATPFFLLAGELMTAGGIIAPLIAFIIFCVTANVSIIDLSLAGITSGVLMGLWLVIAWTYVSRRSEATVTEWPCWSEAFKAIRMGFWAILMPIIVGGGLKAAIFMPTEASMVVVAYSLIVGGLIYRELNLKRIFRALRGAIVMSAAVMFLVAAAGVTDRLITVAQIPFVLVDFLEPLTDTPKLLMLIIGMVMDFVPNVLILTPVLMPLIKIAGIDPI